MSNEVEVAGKYGALAVPDGWDGTMEEYASEIREMLEGDLQPHRFPRIELKHGGARCYRLTDIAGQEVTVPKFSGVVLTSYGSNVFYKVGVDESEKKAPPDCSSTKSHASAPRTRLSNVFPDAPKSLLDRPVFGDCQTCYFNTFGSLAARGEDADKGKICSNRHRIFVMRPGTFLPALLSIPPTSLNAWKTFIVSLAGIGSLLSTVEIEFSTSPGSKGSQEYSILSCQVVRKLGETELRDVRLLRREFKSIMEALPVSALEYDREVIVDEADGEAIGDSLA